MVATAKEFEVDDAGNFADWGDHVSDEEYAEAGA
jgi:hypothetical protein